jgi:hypothetical protein
MGHVLHAIAASLTRSKRLRPIIQGSTARLADPTLAVVKTELDATYGEEIDARARNNLEIYLLADAYVLASGGSSDRDMLIARGGFFKQSLAAFALMSVAAIAGVLRGGLLVQTQPGRVYPLGFWVSLAVAVAAVVVVELFRSRFGFYHRVKIDNTLRHFLALRAKERHKP